MDKSLSYGSFCVLAPMRDSINPVSGKKLPSPSGCSLLDDYICKEEGIVYEVRLYIIIKELEARYGDKITQERKNNA